MKYNLVFTGLKETSHERNLCDVLGKELRIGYWIEFGNVHRFGPKNTENENMRRKFYQIHRPIVARFIYHRDLAYVLENAKTIEVETIWN